MTTNISKTDLKLLAKLIVEEETKMKKEKDILNDKRIYDKNLKKFKKIMENEDSKNRYVESFIEENYDYEDDFNLEYLSQEYYVLKDIIVDIEDIIQDLKTEYYNKTKDLCKKYKYIIDQKLTNKGY
jgi:anion-transporting  ArsA/GET3 family ATPase